MSHQSDFTQAKEHKLGFRKLLIPNNVTSETLVEKYSFELISKDNPVHPEYSKHWFEVHILGIANPVDCELLEISTPTAKEELLTGIHTNGIIISLIRSLTVEDERLKNLILATNNPVLLKL